MTQCRYESAHCIYTIFVCLVSNRHYRHLVPSLSLPLSVTNIIIIPIILVLLLLLFIFLYLDMSALFLFGTLEIMLVS